MEKEIKQFECFSTKDPRFQDVWQNLCFLDQSLIIPAWSSQHWSDLGHEDHHLISLLKSNDEVVAFSLVHHIDYQAHLLKVAVAKNYRQQGLASQILEKTWNLNNFKSMYLEVKEDNSAAVSLYGSLGFKTLHKSEYYYTTGEAALKMLKSF